MPEYFGRHIWLPLTEMARNLKCSHFQTYTVDAQVTDSAAAATALFSGVKTNYKLIGFDGGAEKGNLEHHVGIGGNGNAHARKVDSILKWAQGGNSIESFWLEFWLENRIEISF